MFNFLKVFKFSILNTSSYENKNTTNIYVTNTSYIYVNLFLKNSFNSLFVNIDIAVSQVNNNLLTVHYSCFLTNEKIIIYLNFKNPNNSVKSLSTMFFSTNWVERELQEFNHIKFLGLKDSRRLLTDYTYNKNLLSSDYKMDSYSLISQNLFTRVLHWFFYFLFFLIIVISSLIFYNKSLLHLLVLSEVIILLIVFMLLSLTVYFNIYYLVGFALLILILGGLELSINLLIITINC